MVSGTVSATTADTVTYQWVYSSGTAGPPQTLKFSGPGTRQVAGTLVQSIGRGEYAVICHFAVIIAVAFAKVSRDPHGSSP
jgi:hypothetical protein